MVKKIMKGEVELEWYQARVAELEEQIEAVKCNAMTYARERDRLLVENKKLFEKIDIVLDFLKSWIKGN